MSSGNGGGGPGNADGQDFVPPRITNPRMVSQGAEAILFEGVFEDGHPCVAKHRYSKGYRHPIIDRHALDHRTRSEARILASALRSGAPVPRLLFEDLASHTLYLEKLPGPTVTEAIARHGVLRNRPLAARLAQDIGNSVALLHKAGIIHNDLTMSNIVLRCAYPDAERHYLGGAPQDASRPAAPGVSAVPAVAGAPEGAAPGLPVSTPLTAIIDFGLSTSGKLNYETRAVDLYVLEKSLLALCGETEMFSWILDAYSQAFRAAGPADAAAVERTLQRLQVVRARGRKK